MFGNPNRIAIMTMTSFSLLDRWTSTVRILAEIDCSDDTPHAARLGQAVWWAWRRGLDLSGLQLGGADLGGARLRGRGLREVDLQQAILRGADLRDTDLRDADLSGADLAGADLSGAILRGAVLRDTDLRAVDLCGADLSGADLAKADLSGAVLRGTALRDTDLRRVDLYGADLSGADLSRAVLGSIPVVSALDSRILAAIEAGGGLETAAWHTCETTHCRAGWAIKLAGPAGEALEEALGAAIAGTSSMPRADRGCRFRTSTRAIPTRLPIWRGRRRGRRDRRTGVARVRHSSGTPAAAGTGPRQRSLSTLGDGRLRGRDRPCPRRFLGLRPSARRGGPVRPR